MSKKLKPCQFINACVGQLDGICTISSNAYYRKPCPKQKSKADKLKNEKSELLLWAKDDIVPTDLQVLCKSAANSIKQLETKLENSKQYAGGLENAQGFLDRKIADLEAEIKRLKERIEFALDYLPESPNKAIAFLTPAFKGEVNGKNLAQD